MCLSVFRTISQKPTQLGSPKLDVKLFHDDSQRIICFGVKSSKVMVRSQKNIAGVGLCTLVSAGFFLVELPQFHRL